MAPEGPADAKKPRASKPKVKTGCRTCKKRHIKCDETKPECMRCANFGRKCEGYRTEEEDRPPPEEPLSHIRRRLPSKAVQEFPLPPQTPPVHPPPVWLLFQDEADYHYFCLFRDKTSIDLSAGFEPTLWNRLVLQACDTPSILQLTIATAALSKAQEQDLWEIEKSTHHQYALQQYGRALKGIQKMVSAGQDSTRVALIAALLIFCFESLLAYQFKRALDGRAVTPIQSSLDLIFKRLSGMARPYRNSRTNPRSSPSSSPIDEDLLSAYMRLDGPPLTLISSKADKPAPPANRIFALVFHEDEFCIPGGFATISEARLYLEHIKWRVLPEPRRRHYEKDEQSFVSDSVSMGRQFKQCYNAVISDTAASLNSQFAQWHQAFEPLLEYAMTPVGKSTFIAAATLQIQALSNSLVTAGLSSSKPVENTNGLRAANAIMSLARRLVDDPYFVKGFVFDIGIIPALVIILMLCPDRNLKLEANSIIKDIIPRREGVWDSRIVAEVGDRILASEEDAAIDKTIDPRLLSETRTGSLESTLRQFLGA